MIEPTVGRVVWFYKYSQGQRHKGPLAAHVAKVINIACVNLMVIDEDGNPRPERDVSLYQDVVGEVLPSCDYCCWMPYQKGQAAKYEALAGSIPNVAGGVQTLRPPTPK